MRFVTIVGKGKGVGKKSNVADTEPKPTRLTRRSVVNGNQEEEDEPHHNSQSSSEESTDSHSSSDDDQVDSEDSYKPNKDRNSGQSTSKTKNTRKVSLYIFVLLFYIIKC